MSSDPKWYMPRRNSFSFASIDLFDLTLIVKVFSKDSLDCTSLYVKRKNDNYISRGKSSQKRSRERS